MSARYFIATSPDALRRIADQITGFAVSRARPLEVVVRAPRQEKTNSQRGLWHAVLADMARAMGETPKRVKQIVKEEYYGWERVTLPNGMTFDVLPSSEDEDREGYSRLIDFTYDFAAENQINIPDRRRHET